MQTISSLLVWLYVPLLALMVGVLALLGALALLAPGGFKRMARVFLRPGAVRVLGVFTLLVGAELFVQAPQGVFPIFVKALGVLLFIAGGIRIVLPNLSIILLEKWLALSDRRLRLMSVLFWGMACLLYFVGRIPGVTPTG